MRHIECIEVETVIYKTILIHAHENNYEEHNTKQKGRTMT